MKTSKTTTYLNLPEELSEESIEVEVEFHTENNGIGSYEFWGQKCFDAGVDYLEIDNIEPVFTNESEEVRAEILKYINDKFDECVDQIIDRLDLEDSERGEPEYEHEMNE